MTPIQLHFLSCIFGASSCIFGAHQIGLQDAPASALPASPTLAGCCALIGTSELLAASTMAHHTCRVLQPLRSLPLALTPLRSVRCSLYCLRTHHCKVLRLDLNAMHKKKDAPASRLCIPLPYVDLQVMYVRSLLYLWLFPLLSLLFHLQFPRKIV